MKVNDRVRVKEEWLHAVSNYQAKPLGYRRLVGVVKGADGKGVVLVDFRQLDMPTRLNGTVYGSKARLNAPFRKSIKYDGPGFPVSILEKVR